MAIAFDSAAAATFGNGLTSLTSAAWTIAGANRLLLGAIASGAGSPAAGNAMKWGGSGGTALSQIGATQSLTDGRLNAWQLIAPTAASQTLYGAWPSSQDEECIGGLSYTGVDQVTPTSTPVGNAAAGVGSIATSAITTVAGDIVIAMCWIIDGTGGNPVITPSAGTTRYSNPGSNLHFESMIIWEITAAGSSVTPSASFNDTNMQAGIIAFKLNAAAGGGVTFPPVPEPPFVRANLNPILAR